MKIRIQYTDGSTVEILSVESITLVVSGMTLLAGSEFLIKRFGEGATFHKEVLNLDILGWR